MSASLSLSKPQQIFLTGLDAKFRAYVGGFGSGKTFVGCLDLLIFAGRHPGLLQGYFAPTYRDIRDTFWPTFEEAADSLGFRVTVKKTDKEVHLHRGRAWYGAVICRSMDDPGTIVGFKIARALVDEIDILPADKATAAWRKIIARMRLVVPGVVNGIGVTTTPEGFRFVYNSFKAARAPGYAMVQASTYENERFLPPDYIPSLKASYPQELIDAYLMGEFVNLTSGVVYRHFDRARCRSAETLRDGEALHIGQDFNVGNMASVVFVERAVAATPRDRTGWHAVAELSGVLDTPDLIAAIRATWPGRTIHIYPDASGAGRRCVDASTSDIALLKQAGFVVRARAANPAVRERVLAVNTAFSRDRLWVNDKACPRFTAGLEQQGYDRNGMPDKAAGLDHHNDAAGYFVHWVMPVVKPSVRGQQAIRGFA